MNFAPQSKTANKSQICRMRFVLLSWTVYALHTIKPGNHARLSTPVAPVYYLCGATSSCKNFIFNLVAGESFLSTIRQIYKPSIAKWRRHPYIIHIIHVWFRSIGMESSYANCLNWISFNGYLSWSIDVDSLASLPSHVLGESLKIWPFSIYISYLFAPFLYV